jgi:hypothetical protein
LRAHGRLPSGVRSNLTILRRGEPPPLHHDKQHG